MLTMTTDGTRDLLERAHKVMEVTKSTATIAAYDVSNSYYSGSNSNNSKMAAASETTEETTSVFRHHHDHVHGHQTHPAEGRRQQQRQRRPMIFLVAAIALCTINFLMLTSRSSYIFQQRPAAASATAATREAALSSSSFSTSSSAKTSNDEGYQNNNPLPEHNSHKHRKGQQQQDDDSSLTQISDRKYQSQSQSMISEPNKKNKKLNSSLLRPSSSSSSATSSSTTPKSAQGICGRSKNKDPPSSSTTTKATSTTTSTSRQPKFLFAIPSTLTNIESQRRQVMRETFLSFDAQIHELYLRSMLSSVTSPATTAGATATAVSAPAADRQRGPMRKTSKQHEKKIKLNTPPLYNRVCSLQEWTCANNSNESNKRTLEVLRRRRHVREECQIIYAFFVGGNSTAGPSLVDESLTDFRTMIMTSNTTSDGGDEEPGLIQLNIRENQFDGKMTTILQFAALVGREFPSIDYVAKVDSDTMVFTPNFLETMQIRHEKILPLVHGLDQNQNNNNGLSTSPLPFATERIYGGVRYPKTFCGMNETHHPCPLPLVGDSYMSGELNFMSMDLAAYVVSDDCPRDSITLPHEDVSLSNYVYSYTNNSKVIHKIQQRQQHQQEVDTSIHQIFISRDRKLHTFNQSADWVDMKLGRAADITTQLKRYLWGHCNPRAHGNKEIYKYFKTPSKVREFWKVFISAYYEQEYGRPAIWT
jgi:hypothetical protein